MTAPRRFLSVKRSSNHPGLRRAVVLFAILGLTAHADAQRTAAIRPTGPASLQAGILAAYKAGQKKIVIPPGTYEIPAPAGGCHLVFDDLKDFEIEGTGVTLLLADQTKATLLFNRCRQVTLRGITLRNATLPFTQGVIESVAPDRKSCEIRIDAGYPTTLDDPKFFAARGSFYLFDRMTRRLKDGSVDYGRTAVDRLGPDRFRLVCGGPLGPEVEAGDRLATRGTGSMGVHNEHCTGMLLEGVTMEYSGGFGFFETGGDGGNRYVGIKVKPGPKPAGATEEPLMSENADGFHSAGVRKGPTIENGVFARMPDDGIAIHGNYQLVREAGGARLVISQPWAAAPYEAGERVGILSGDGVPLGEAKVAAIRALPDGYKAPQPTEFPHFRDNRCFFELTLDRNLPVQPGAFTATIDRLGSGYVLRNNTILDHRARGLLLKARDGLVENNFIDGSSIAGIVLAPELWWGEADYSQNITIRGNTITHVGYATTDPGNRQAGALTVLGERAAPEARGHRNILVENNVFAAVNGVQIVLDGIEGGTVRGNRFVDAQRQPNTRGGARGIDTGALVFIDRARNVLVADNTAERLGASNTRLVATTANAAGITGIKDGIHMLSVANPPGGPMVSWSNPPEFSYPADGVARREVRDPCIIREGDTYYLVFTMWPFTNRTESRLNLPAEGGSPGIQLFSSKDLKNWQAGNWLVKSSELPPDCPYKDRFWAPEIHKIGGKFYLIFTADNWLRNEYNPAGRWGTAGYAFVGVADKVTGPYDHITWINGGVCDTTLLEGADGQTYAVMPKGNVYVRRIDLSGLGQGKVQLVGEEKLAVQQSSADTALGTDANYLEGPWAERSDKGYVLFYAEFFRDPAAPQKAEYWTGAAYADQPMGPWHKDPRGRVFWGGHLAAFAGPDNRRWLCYRREQPVPQRATIGTDPFEVDGSGRVLTDGPTSGFQTLPLPR